MVINMIKVTRLNRTSLYINCDMIEFIESTPDTVISLADDKKIIVKESVEEVIEKIVDYQRQIKVLPDCGTVIRKEVK